MPQITNSSLTCAAESTLQPISLSPAARPPLYLSFHWQWSPFLSLLFYPYNHPCILSSTPPRAKWPQCWCKGAWPCTVTNTAPPLPAPPPAINRHMLTCWFDQSHTHTWSALVTAASHGWTGCSSTWRTWGGDGEGRGQRTSEAGGTADECSGAGYKASQLCDFVCRC